MFPKKIRKYFLNFFKNISMDFICKNFVVGGRCQKKTSRLKGFLTRIKNRPRKTFAKYSSYNVGGISEPMSSIFYPDLYLILILIFAQY